ncbi:MAG TPA: hypothetical protein VF334_09845 [Polyangia bacterium]
MSLTLCQVAVALALFAAGCPANDGGSGDLAAGGGDDMAMSSSGSPDLYAPSEPNGATMEVLGTPSSWSGAASFYTGTVQRMSPQCSYTLVGQCSAAHCTIGTADGGTVAPYKLVSAGDVAVTVGAMAPIAFTVQPGNYYLAPGSMTQPLFAGGEMITFSTSGAVAPASSTTVQAPVPPTLTTPSQAPPYTISRASDFPFAWTGGGPGQLTVAVQTNPSSIDPGTPFGSVRCTFAISDGSGVIPSAALAVLPTGSATLTIGVSNQAVNVIGDWALTAVVGTYPKTPGGPPTAGGQATIN